MRGGGDQWTVQEYSKLKQGKEMYEEIRHYMGGFFRTVPKNVSAFHTGLPGFYGVDYGRDFVPSMDAYDRAVSWNSEYCIAPSRWEEGQSHWIWLEMRRGRMGQN